MKIDKGQSMKLFSKVDVCSHTAYLNVLGRSSDPTGAAFWRSALESGGVSEEEFILQLLGGVSAGSPDRNYLDQKLDIGAYFSIIKGMSDPVDANAAMNLYDGSMGSIRAAISFIDPGIR